MRLFIAINFDGDTKRKILDIIERLRKRGKGSFTRPENLHLTLAFLGEVPEEDVGEIKAAMDSVEVRSMRLKFAGIGCFRRDDELWWTGIKDDPDLMKLQKDLVRALRDRGFSPDDKKFRPHITLARRMHIGRVAREELLPEPFSARADAISLMVSERTGGKLTYTEIYRKEAQGQKRQEN